MVIITRRALLYSLLLGHSIANTIVAKPEQEQPQCVPSAAEVGECDNVGVRVIHLVTYDQEAIFGQNEQGVYRCLELQEQIEELNKEFDKKRSNLRERSRQLKMLYQDQEANNDPQQMAVMMKEQSALDIDAKLASQEFQNRLNQVQTSFMREVYKVITELADELSWELVLPIDKKVAFAVAKVDVTNTIVKRLNDKYRTKQRTKKFAEPAAKKETQKR